MIDNQQRFDVLWSRYNGRMMIRLRDEHTNEVQAIISCHPTDTPRAGAIQIDWNEPQTIRHWLGTPEGQEACRVAKAAPNHFVILGPYDASLEERNWDDDWDDD